MDDTVGNVATIADYESSAQIRETQTFGYDERDRLVSATGGGFTGGPASYTTSFIYDSIGNLTSKAGRRFMYPTGGSARPHAVTCANWSTALGSCVSGESYGYDANGNLTSGGGRTITWSAENQPLNIVQSGLEDGFTYNADNERIKLTTTLPTTRTTTFYFGGLAEEIVVGSTATKRHAYTFNGQVIAQRDVPSSGASTVTYLHGDHLGSVAAASTMNTAPTVTKQYFTPWGEACMASFRLQRR